MGAEQSTQAPAPTAHEPQQQHNARPTASQSAAKPTPRALVVCGPSGVGKGTLISQLMEGSDKFTFSVSHTTRAMRENEKDGVHYHFTTKENFTRDVAQGLFLEHATVHGNMYGTTKAAVQAVLDAGKVAVLDIDVQGARLVRTAKVPAIFVFIAPPSLEELERRLRGRGTESEEQVTKRLAAAKDEINSLNEKGLFDYLLINDKLEETLAELKSIAQRALEGKEAEPGHVPERVELEDEAPSSADAPAAQAATPSTSAALAPAKGPAAAAAAVSAGMGQLPGLEKWQGKVAMVTGASSGIGFATCVALAQAGLRVVAVARRRDKLERLQKHVVEVGNVAPVDFLPVVCDITKEAEVAALPRILAKRWPGAGIDVLVNNAGLSRNDASMMEGNTASWVEMVSTNILGTAMCTREVMQDMKRRGQYGHIFNMVGLSGHRIPDGPQGGGFYCGTKAAVRTMTEGLRQEARGAKLPLRVTAISPGVVETEFFTVRAFGNQEAAADAVKASPGQLKPEDVANAILWALSAPDHMEVNDVVMRPREQLL